MANTQSMCTSFMGELLVGAHQFGAVTLTSRTSLTAPTTDTFKALLVIAASSPNVNAAQTNVGTPGTGTPTTSNIGTNEVSSSGTGYTAGGVTVTNATAPTATNSSATAGVAYWTPSASFVYTNVTLTTAFDTVVLYNSTQGGKTVSVHTFGSQTITAGTFTLTMPTNSTTTALLRLATT
jgi:hypothetical protein